MARFSQNLLRRDGRYYFRQRIPLDLVSFLACKEFKKALGTACPRQARIMTNKMRGIIETYFDDLRGLMAEDQNKKKENAKDRAFKLMEEIVVTQAKVNKERQETIRLLNNQARLEGLLNTEWLDRAKKAQKEAEGEAKNLIKQNEVNAQMLAHLLQEKASPQSKPLSSQPAKLLSDYVDLALIDNDANKKPSKHTLDQKRTRMMFFLRTVEDKPITEYSRKDILNYKGWLEKLPQTLGKSSKDKTRTLEHICKRPGKRMATDTLEKHFQSVKEVFEAAARDCSINLGILENIVLHGEESQKRKIWNTHQLNELFNSPVYSGRKGRAFRFTYHKGNKFYKDVWFWLPVIAIYTGMRLEEIAKLRVCDFKEEDGIPYIDVNEDIGRLKNKQSARYVPIHPDLYEFGIHALVRGRKEERIFHELKPTGPERDKYGADYSGDFTIYRQKVGIYEELRDFHSFRHTFASALFDKIKDVLTVAHICGHSSEDTDGLAKLKGIKVQTTSYIHIDLKASYEAIKQLKYDDVDLSNLLKEGAR